MSEHYEKLFQEHLQEAFGDRREEFSAILTDHLRRLWLLGVKTRAPEDMTAREEDAFITGAEDKIYPATVGKCSPDWGASDERNRKRPPCPSCGGRGLGDYPYPCNTCGGTGNA